MSSLRDVALRAQVSITTASLVLGGKGRLHRIAATTEERVRAAAAALEYRANYHARMFRSGRSDVLGFAMSVVDRRDFGGPFWSAMLEGGENRAREEGRDLLLISGRDPGAALRRAVGYFRERRIDALVVPGHFARLLDDALDVPVVVLAAHASTPWPSVTLDQPPGITEAVSHLADLGHRRLLWVESTRVYPDSERRGRLVVAAAQRVGLAVDIVDLPIELGARSGVAVPLAALNAATFAASTAQMGTLAAQTAVFCFNDALALGVMAALQRAGRRIPEDVSILGFDDLYGAMTIPRLTTVSHRLEEMGAAAVDLALKLAANPTDTAALRGHVETLPSRLVLGGTTASAWNRGPNPNAEPRTGEKP